MIGSRCSGIELNATTCSLPTPESSSPESRTARVYDTRCAQRGEAGCGFLHPAVDWTFRNSYLIKCGHGGLFPAPPM
jgi:hypothetical protein